MSAFSAIARYRFDVNSQGNYSGGSERTQANVQVIKANEPCAAVCDHSMTDADEISVSTFLPVRSIRS